MIIQIVKDLLPLIRLKKQPKQQPDNDQIIFLNKRYNYVFGLSKDCICMTFSAYFVCLWIGL